MWLDAYPSPHNGLTMCVGSYASRIDNKVEDIVNEFADKVNFVHLRNVRKVQNGSFVESDHIDGDVDMFKVISTLLFEQDRRKKMGVRHQARLRLPFR
jgi:mannonate dehydratase